MKKIYQSFSSVLILIPFLTGCSKEPNGPFLIDSAAKVDSVYAKAGRDFEISSPTDFIFLDASETAQANPDVNDIQYKWRCLTFPQGATPPNILRQDGKLAEVNGLETGKYVFELEIRYQHLKSLDFVDVNVKPDELIGKTITYKSEWKMEVNQETDYKGLLSQIISNDLIGRDKNKIQIEYWNAFRSAWKPIVYFSLFPKEGMLKLDFPSWDYPEYFNWRLIVGKDVPIRIYYN